MRAYFFGNMYLSPIQHGIQAAHVVHELFNKYSISNQKCLMLAKAKKLYEWSNNHKTMILLNGGSQQQLNYIYESVLSRSTLELPYAKFHEDESTLNGALTSVGVIVPEYIYSGTPYENIDNYSAQLLYATIKSHNLA